MFEYITSGAIRRDAPVPVMETHTEEKRKTPIGADLTDAYKFFPTEKPIKVLPAYSIRDASERREVDQRPTVDVVELHRHYFEDSILGWTMLDGVARVRRPEDLPYGFSQQRVIFHEGWHNAHPPWLEIDPCSHEGNTHKRELTRPPVKFNYTGSASHMNQNYGIL